MTKTLHVSTLEGLTAALRGATGGETIFLAPGEYGTFSLSARSGFPLTFPSNVTIASADPGNPAILSGLDLRGVGNLTLDGLVFDYTFEAGQPIHHRPFQIAGTNLTIRNSVFDGDVAQGVSAAADGFGYAIGLSVRGVTGLTLENNEVFGFHRGFLVTESRDISIIGNDLHSLRMDGMNFAQVQRVTIEGNHLHDFARSLESGDHADMIQFWTAGTTQPSTDIVIRDNLLDIGAGGWTQSIFMRNEVVDHGRAGPEMYYQNVLIEGNTIYNAHLHGIALGQSSGVVIRNNAVLHADSAAQPGSVPTSVQIPRISVSSVSTNVTIEQNATSTLAGWTGQNGWSVTDNAFVQPSNPRAPGFYGDVFVGSTLGLGENGHSYLALPGGLLDMLDAGSAAVLNGGSGLRAEFHVSQEAGNPALRLLDATVSQFNGQPLPPGATYLWTFADGTTASGPVVRHPFPEAGQHAVTLTVRLPDGTTDASQTRVAIAGQDVLSLGPDGFRAEAFDADTLFAPVAAGVVTLGASGVAASIARTHLAPVLAAESFEIGLTLAAARPGAAGELLRLHESFIASVTATGELGIRFFTEAGETRLTTTGAGLGDMAAHDLRIRVENGQLTVHVDGMLAGAAELRGPMIVSGNQALVFGNPWGSSNFAGTLSAFEIDIDMADYAAARDALQLIRDQQSVPAPPAVGAEEEAILHLPPEGEIDLGTGPAVPDSVEPIVVSPGPLPPEPEQRQPTAPAALQLPTLDSYVLDIAGIGQGPNGPAPAVRLVGDAAVVDGANGPAIRMDGHADHTALGRLTAFETASRLGFSVELTPEAAGLQTSQRVVWNHMKVGLGLSGAAIDLRVATADEGFKRFVISDADIAADKSSRITVLLDTDEDRLQVLVDDRIVLDHDETDFEIVGAGGRDWGWTLGAPWSATFDGAISDFRIGDRFEFLDNHQPDIGQL